MIAYFGKTTRGLKRENNEDAYLISAYNGGYPYLFAVADGIGGQRAGDVASKEAISILKKYFLDTPFSQNAERDSKSFIEYISKKINDHLLMISDTDEEKKGLGTTLTLFLLFEKEAYIGHIGDSRFYGLDADSKVTRYTEDHTYINELIKNGDLSKEEAQTHPKRNMITRALGCNKEYEMDFISIKKLKDSKYILCTDGLFASHENLSILEEVLELDEEATCERLIRFSLDEGGIDNATVISIKV